MRRKDFHLFISYASEDRKAFVEPLAQGLINEGLSVWYDQCALHWGDSLWEQIDYGLAYCQKGIVVLSEAFFSKNWTKRELAGLVARQTSGDNVLLPIWHQIDKEYILQYSPPLADIVALSSSHDLADIILQAKKAVFDSKFSSRKTKSTRCSSKKPIIEDFSNLIFDKHKGRRFLEHGLERVLHDHKKQARRNKSMKMSIIILDIDDTTAINKSHGHAIGNLIIKQIIETIQSTLKGVKKHVGRCGDDTFFAVLHGVGTGKTKHYSDLLKANISHYPWNTLSAGLRVTCSLGISWLAKKEQVIDAVIRAAIGMNESKQSGKDIVSEGPVEIPAYTPRSTYSYWS